MVLKTFALQSLPFSFLLEEQNALCTPFRYPCVVMSVVDVADDGGVVVDGGVVDDDGVVDVVDMESVEDEEVELYTVFSQVHLLFLKSVYGS
ncbi:MAG: hypothetical protein ACTSUE_06490 [Promethearchaeota archaeon]